MIQIYMGKSLSFMQYADLEAVLEQIEIVRNSSYQRWLQSLLYFDTRITIVTNNKKTNKSREHSRANRTNWTKCVCQMVLFDVM